MSEQVATYNADTSAILEQVVVGGNLAGLSPAQRLSYYKQVCESLGINPLTKPFQYITLNGKLTLYATRDATDQLRRRHGISITRLEEKTVGDVYIIKATARDKDGREDTSTGAVSIKELSGDALANALMKAETKAKRRVTLSIVGLGWLDETEIDTIPAKAKAVEETGDLEDKAQETVATTPEFAPTQIPVNPKTGKQYTKQELIGLLGQWERKAEAMAIALPPFTDNPSIAELVERIKLVRDKINEAGVA